MPEKMTPEDEKLFTLARGARARVSSEEGAAVRDETGRTYSAVEVSLPSLSLTALQLAIAQAVAAGAGELECAVVVGRAPEVTKAERAALVGVGEDEASLTLYRCQPDGTVLDRISLP